jgi:hypothetical protein
MFQQATRGTGAAGVDGVPAYVDVLDDAFLVNHERRAVGELLLLIEDTVLFGDRSLEVAQERKVDAFLLGKGRVGGKTIYTNAQHLRAGLLELGDISLICLEFLGSAAGER